MVLESLVASILNRYLSDIIEDLDTSNLGISVFGGDINLSKLRIKSSAFEKFDIPIRVVHGYLGHLRIRVPWKNLYNDQTEVEIEDLFIQAKLLTDIPYEEEKEKYYEKIRIKEKLDLYEKLDMNQFNKNGKTENVSTVEKIAAHVIKNSKVNIKRILIIIEREDMCVNQKMIFGFKLDSLMIETTDEFFKKTLIKEISSVIYKILQIESVSIIWKEDCRDQPFQQWMKECMDNFSSNDKIDSFPPLYFIKPISMIANLCINLKPHQNKKIPMVSINLKCDEIVVHLTDFQYLIIMKALDDLDRNNQRFLFRKYRPNTHVHDFPLKWWKFALQSIINIKLKNKFRINVIKMLDCWKKFKTYKELHLVRLTNSNNSRALTTAQINLIDQIELTLPIHTLVLARKIAQRTLSIKNISNQKKSTDWFNLSSWSPFSWSNSEKSQYDNSITSEQIADEMKKMESSLGIDDNDFDMKLYRPDYVKFESNLFLQSVSLILSDKNSKNNVAKIVFTEINGSLSNYPVANSIKFVGSLYKVEIYQENNKEKHILFNTVFNVDDGSSLINNNLLRVLLELNPLDDLKKSVRFHLNLKSTNFYYIEDSIRDLFKFFSTELQSSVKRVQDRALKNVSSMKNARQQAIIDALQQKNQSYDININIDSSNIIIQPKDFCQSLRICCGSLKIQTISQINAENMIEFVSGVPVESYEFYKICLTDLSVFVKEDYSSNVSHFLHPFSFNLFIGRCHFNSYDLNRALFFLNVPPINVNIQLVNFILLMTILKSFEKVIDFSDSKRPIIDSKSYIIHDSNTNEISIDSDSTNEKFYDCLDDSDNMTSSINSSLDYSKCVNEISKTSDTGNLNVTTAQLLNKKLFDYQLRLASLKIQVEWSDHMQTFVEQSHLHFNEKQPQNDFFLKFIKDYHENISNNNKYFILEMGSLFSNFSFRQWDSTITLNLSYLKCSIGEKSYDSLNFIKNVDLIRTSSESSFSFTCKQNNFISLIQTNDVEWQDTDEAYLASLIFDQSYNRYCKVVDLKISTICISIDLTTLNEVFLLNLIVKSMSLFVLKVFPHKMDIHMTNLSSSSNKQSDNNQRSLQHSSYNQVLFRNSPINDMIQSNLKCKLEGVELSLIDYVSPLCGIIVKDFKTIVTTYKNSDMLLKCSLNNVTITDCTSTNSLYQTVVTVSHDQLFKLQLKILNEPLDDVSMLADIKIGRLNCIVLSSILFSLIDFFNELLFIKSLISNDYNSDFSLNISKNQNDNVDKMSFVKLNIEIMAPYLIIPENSYSKNIILANLGYLKITNEIVTLPEKIVDRISVDVSDVLLSRFIIQKEIKNIGELFECNQEYLLKPANLSIIVDRALEIFPGIIHSYFYDLTFIFNEIKCELSSQDINCLMYFPIRNITEYNIKKISYDKEVNKIKLSKKWYHANVLSSKSAKKT